MPSSRPTTTAQARFLRAFHDNPAGPPPDQWPSPAILRRWLRKSGFRRALKSIREALQFQSDLHLAAAANAAAHNLQITLSGDIQSHPSSTPDDPAPASPATNPRRDPTDTLHHTRRLHALTALLRLSHLRQRYPFNIPDVGGLSPEATRAQQIVSLLRIVHPDARVGEALEFINKRIAVAEEVLKAEKKKRAYP